MPGWHFRLGKTQGRCLRANAIFVISPNASQEGRCRRDTRSCRGLEVPESSICFYSCSRLRSFRNRLFAKVEKGSVLLCNSEAAHEILNRATPKWESRLPCDTGTPAPSRGWWPRPRLPRAPRRAAGPDPRLVRDKGGAPVPPVSCSSPQTPLGDIRANAFSSLEGHLPEKDYAFGEEVR